MSFDHSQDQQSSFREKQSPCCSQQFLERSPEPQPLPLPKFEGQQEPPVVPEPQKKKRKKVRVKKLIQGSQLPRSQQEQLKHEQQTRRRRSEHRQRKREKELDQSQQQGSQDEHNSRPEAGPEQARPRAKKHKVSHRTKQKSSIRGEQLAQTPAQANPQATHPPQSQQSEQKMLPSKQMLDQNMLQILAQKLEQACICLSSQQQEPVTIIRKVKKAQTGSPGNFQGLDNKLDEAFASIALDENQTGLRQQQGQSRRAGPPFDQELTNLTKLNNNINTILSLTDKGQRLQLARSIILNSNSNLKHHGASTSTIPQKHKLFKGQFDQNQPFQQKVPLFDEPQPQSQFISRMEQCERERQAHLIELKKQSQNQLLRELKEPAVDEGSRKILQKIGQKQPLYKRTAKLMIKRKQWTEKQQKKRKDAQQDRQQKQLFLQKQLIGSSKKVNPYFYQEKQSWIKKRQEVIAAKEKAKQDKLFKECTFKPELSKKSVKILKSARKGSGKGSDSPVSKSKVKQRSSLQAQQFLVNLQFQQAADLSSFNSQLPSDAWHKKVLKRQPLTPNQNAAGQAELQKYEQKLQNQSEQGYLQKLQLLEEESNPQIQQQSEEESQSYYSSQQQQSYQSEEQYQSQQQSKVQSKQKQPQSQKQLQVLHQQQQRPLSNQNMETYTPTQVQQEHQEQQLQSQLIKKVSPAKQHIKDWLQ